MPYKQRLSLQGNAENSLNKYLIILVNNHTWDIGHSMKAALAKLSYRVAFKDSRLEQQVRA